MAYGAFHKERPPEGGLVDGLRRVSERHVESGLFILVNTHSEYKGNEGPRRRDAPSRDGVVAGVLRLRPTKRGSPAVITAPTAAISPLRIAASAVSCVPPSGASISTMSADLPAASTPQSSR